MASRRRTIRGSRRLRRVTACPTGPSGESSVTYVTAPACMPDTVRPGNADSADADKTAPNLRGTEVVSTGCRASLPNGSGLRLVPLY